MNFKELLEGKLSKAWQDDIRAAGEAAAKEYASKAGKSIDDNSAPTSGPRFADHTQLKNREMANTPAMDRARLVKGKKYKGSDEISSTTTVDDNSSKEKPTHNFSALLSAWGRAKSPQSKDVVKTQEPKKPSEIITTTQRKEHEKTHSVASHAELAKQVKAGKITPDDAKDVMHKIPPYGGKPGYEVRTNSHRLADQLSKLSEGTELEEGNKSLGALALAGALGVASALPQVSHSPQQTIQGEDGKSYRLASNKVPATPKGTIKSKDGKEYFLHLAAGKSYPGLVSNK